MSLNMPSPMKDTAWDRLENAIKEDRPLQPIRKLVIRGSVDVVFRRADTPALVVAGESADAVAAVRTEYKGDKLVIEREGVSISFGSGHMTFHGTVGSVVMGDIVNGQATGQTVSLRQPRAVVSLALPESPRSRSRAAATSPCSICGKMPWTWRFRVRATSPSPARSPACTCRSRAPAMSMPAS